MNVIVRQTDAQNKLEKPEAGLAGAPAWAVSAVKSMNLPEIPRNFIIGNITMKVSILPSFKLKYLKGRSQEKSRGKVI